MKIFMTGGAGDIGPWQLDNPVRFAAGKTRTI
jgi:hypothetical protein